jgi:hypothetical protein
MAAVVAVAVATLAVVVLEQVLAVPNAAAVYLVGVAAVAIAAGTSGAVLTAVLAVVVYDFFFTDPRHTLAVADPGEWLNLLLLLFVAVTVGQLAALQRRRADLAVAREREARALVEVARALATRPSLLLIDEVAAGLTDAEVDEFIGLVGRIKSAGITIVWIEHVMKTMLRATDRLMALAGGRIIASGLPDDVIKAPEVQRVYLGA